MRATWRGVFALGTAVLLSGVLASACGSDDSGGGGTSTGGKDGGGTGGIGGSTGGSGGSTGGSGGTGGAKPDAGCLPAPDPNDPDACGTCQDEKHAECACDAEITACFNDPECSALFDCIADGEGDAGAGQCPGSFDETEAACVLQCAALHPTGKAKYLAMDKCMYCSYCGGACDTNTYCTALDNQPDGSTTDGGADAATDATSDATSDAASDATADAASDATADAASDAAADAASDATTDAASDATTSDSATD